MNIDINYYLACIEEKLYNALDLHNYYDNTTIGFNEWLAETSEQWVRGEYNDISEVQDELNELYELDKRIDKELSDS